MILLFQLLTGVLLSFGYGVSFESVISLTRESKGGSGLRWVHSNGASLFFLGAYLHLARGLSFSGFKHKGVWLSGWGLLLLLMGSAFLGYALPLGQMSFWAATVITSMFSVLTPKGVEWIWGDYGVSESTISFFYSLHFLLPLSMLGVMMFHLLSLHTNKSSAPVPGSSSIPFHPLFSSKDSYDVFPLLIFSLGVSSAPLFFSDPLGFEGANTLSSPLHILPEWYFLWAYAILRGIPSKLGGVLSLLLSLVVLLALPSFRGKSGSLFFLLFGSGVLNLLWLGSVPVELPFSSLALLFTGIYFLSIPLLFI